MSSAHTPDKRGWFGLEGRVKKNVVTEMSLQPISRRELDHSSSCHYCVKLDYVYERASDLILQNMWDIDA